MSDENLRLLTAIAAIIAAIAGPTGLVLVAYLNAKLNRVEKNVDGKLTDLLEAREDAAGAKGELKERDANRKYQSGTPTGTAEDPVNVKPVKGKV